MLAQAGGRLGRVTLLEFGETDERNEPARLGPPLGLRHTGDLEREAGSSTGTPRKRRLLLEVHADQLVRATDRLPLDCDAPLKLGL